MISKPAVVSRELHEIRWCDRWGDGVGSVLAD